MTTISKAVAGTVAFGLYGGVVGVAGGLVSRVAVKPFTKVDFTIELPKQVGDVQPARVQAEQAEEADLSRRRVLAGAGIGGAAAGLTTLIVGLRSKAPADRALPIVQRFGNAGLAAAAGAAFVLGALAVTDVIDG